MRVKPYALFDPIGRARLAQLEALWKLKQVEAIRTDHDALMEWAILVFVVALVVLVSIWWAQ